MENGYENIYNGLVAKLGGCNFMGNSTRLGLKADGDGNVPVSFLRRVYLITKSGVQPVDGRPVSVILKSVLLYYIMSGGDAYPTYSFVPLNRLAGNMDGQNALAKDIMSAPLMREFGTGYGLFARSAERLGGMEEKGCAAGCHTWLFELLPKIPAKIVFYEADDEFPADINIMFDETAPSFMDFECLAFLCGCFCEALIMRC